MEAIRSAHETVDLSDLVTKADLKADLAKAKTDLLKWFVGIALAQSALTVTLLKLVPAQ